MENYGSDKLALPITPEQLRKTDLDFETIKSLAKYAQENDSILVLSGGYATEALCGGNITRPHGDIDAHFLTNEIENSDQIFLEVSENILFKEPTLWKVRKRTNIKVDFLEDDEPKPFFDRRRLEFTLHKKEGVNLATPAFLINSQGEKIEVYVVEINELLASKIHKLYSLRDGVIDDTKDRHTDDRDIYDLKRLLNSSDINQEKQIQILAERHVQAEGEKNPAGQAQEEYDYINNLYRG